MSRRILAKLILLLIVTFGVYAAASPSQVYPLYMIGHVDTAQDLTISINESVLPFDLEDGVVADHPNSANTIAGLQIGTYSLFTNDSSFELIVSHTPLVLSGTKAEDTQFDSINYRLYLVTHKDAANTSDRFKSCLSSANAENLDAVLSGSNYIDIGVEDVRRNSNAMISLVNYAIYVSLEDNGRDQEHATTESVIENLSPGYYSSTMYFFLIGS